MVVYVHQNLRLYYKNNYSGMSDNNIVKLAQSGDILAFEYIIKKYKNLVRTKVKPYFLVGAERDDLIQVGMIGLWHAIKDFQPEKDISFISFARICIERHVLTAIKSATRHKQSPLNNAVSIDYFIDEKNPDYTLSDLLVSDDDFDPAQLLMKKEDKLRFIMSLKHLLSNFEWKVLSEYNLGKSYKEIANDLKCNIKSVDNALGRIKKKVGYAEKEVYAYPA
ncbi:MAG: RNA polymerase sporulation sigma factor SigH [Armatimonadota bacterium]